MIIVAFLIALCIPIVLIVLIRKMLRSTKKGIRILSVLPLAVLLFLSYHVYFAIFPKEEFYLDEWTRNTDLQMPSSAKFIKKSASYPDQHGDYWSGAIIELSEEDYQGLKNEVALSSKTTVDTTRQRIGISMSYENFAREYPKSELMEVYRIDEGIWFKVGFYMDGKTFIFERSSS